MERRTSIVWALLLWAGGCAGATTAPHTSAPARELAPLPAAATPEEAAGYVAGRLRAADKAKGFGFVLVDGTGREHVVPFDDIHPQYELPRGQPTLVAVPPGTYRVAYWTSARMGKIGLPDRHVLTNPFVVRGGRVVFLGAFAASQAETIGAPKPEGLPIGTELGIQPEDISADEARAALAAAYPRFTGVPLQCLTCTPSFRPAQAK